MTYPKEIILILPVIISLIIAILSWKYADYFLSRKDHYINSRYELFTKKLGWFVSAFFTSLFITFKILETLMKSK
jgi:hypothetical protein